MQLHNLKGSSTASRLGNHWRRRARALNGIKHLATEYPIGLDACRRWLLALLVCINSLALADSNTDTYPLKISFRNIMQNEDIALGEVEAILQDHQGFMWLGGRNALLRYDGYEFLNVLAATNAEDLSQTTAVNQTLELFEDSRHVLWAATRSGLYKYDPDHELLLPQVNSGHQPILRGLANALAESPNGELLVGTGSGLYIFNTQTHDLQVIEHKLDDPQSLLSNTINDLLVDSDGMVWVGLDEGLVRIDWKSKQQTRFIPDPANPNSAANNGVKTLARDLKGNLWVGTDNGIYRMDPASGSFRRYLHDEKNPYSLGDNISRQIYVDKHGWVWTGSDQGGISLYDEVNDRFLNFSHHDSNPGDISSNTIRRIYEDNLGDMWIGTYPSGVNFYDRSTAAIRAYRKEADPSKGLMDNNVEAVEEDKDGNLWLGAGGATRYNPQTESFTQYVHSNGSDSRVSSGSILNGVVDSDGLIWFGSWAHGILRYDPKQDRFEELPTDPNAAKRGETSGPKLNDQMVWSVYEDRQKILWISTHFNGLTSYDKKTGLYTYYPHNKDSDTGLSCPVVWTTFEDSHGHLWVGTAYGLNLMDRDKGTFKRYFSNPEDPHSLANNSILTIWEDHKGRLWFGTDAGLHLYHPDTNDFSVYGNKDGFVDQGIRSIVEDPAGNLWLGTNNGIVMFNPDSKLVRNYVRYNGQSIGGTATGAAVATRKGEIAFGTRNGLYIFNTNKLVTNEKAPPIALTDFRIFTQKVPVGGSHPILTKTITQTEKITLDYTESMIAFSFAALNYRDPEKNQYAYKLEGFDDKWRYVATQRTALYTNLPAGTYQFHVKASNNDGIWNEQGRSITLTILPAPWKTWWAYSIYALSSLGLLLFFVYTQHQKVLRERKTSRELEIKVNERTAELRHKNTELEQAYAQLEVISLSDPLTGLSNRRYLQKLMPMDIAKVQREYDTKTSKRIPTKPSLDITFFILDVDYFKSVNDTYGHIAGDKLLIDLSELLTNICRESDCVVRWGGEEFLIVSRFADRDEAPLMAERVRQAIERHQFTLPDGTTLYKTCSMGFACFPFLADKPMALSWEQVIDIADHALYAAKKSGRNRSVGLAAAPNISEKMLYQRISRDIKVLINNNELIVISTEKESLIWN